MVGPLLPALANISPQLRAIDVYIPVAAEEFFIPGGQLQLQDILLFSVMYVCLFNVKN